MSHPFLRLLIRTLANTLVLGLLAKFFSGIQFEAGLLAAVIAGALLAFLNAALRPILITLSLPIVLVSLGLFHLVIAAILVRLVALITPLQIDSWLLSLLAGSGVSCVNFMVTKLFNRLWPPKGREL